MWKLVLGIVFESLISEDLPSLNTTATQSEAIFNYFFLIILFPINLKVLYSAYIVALIDDRFGAMRELDGRLCFMLLSLKYRTVA